MIFSVDIDKKQVEMSLRSKPPGTTDSPELTYKDLQEGQMVDGRVKKVEDYGVFVTINNSKLSGLCHKSEVRVSLIFEIPCLT